MIKNKNKIACIILIIFIGNISSQVLAASCQAYTTEQHLPSGIAYGDIGNKIEAYVQEHMDTTAGLALSIFDAKDVLYTNTFGYADVEQQNAVDADTVFEWGSATKMLVWVSVMQLWEQGKIDLDTDICRYLPDNFLTNLKYDTPITMTMLMNHTAGFQECYVDLFVKDTADVPTLEEALAAHKPAQIYAPGTVTAYSNWGVALAGYIVERVSGMPFYEYVKENIFDPLKMEHSALAPDLSDNPWVKEQRRQLQCYTTGRTLIPECFYYITLYPAGMCTSTLHDFETFARALLDKNSVLFQFPDTWTELFSATSYYGDTDIPRNCHGFWVLPMGVLAVGHGGNTAGCSSYLLLALEEGIGVAVMTNQSREAVYNEEMMPLIFGSYAASAYKKDAVQTPEGFYRSARTVRKGALKFMSLSFAKDDWGEEEFWAYVETDSIQKICFAYGDYVKVSMGTFLLEMGLVLLWAAALLFSALSLLVKCIRLVYWKMRKKKTSIFLGKWSAAASVLQLSGMVLLADVSGNVSAYASGHTYVWKFVIFGILAIAMGIVAVYGIVQIIKNKSSKIRKVYNFMTTLFLVSSISNICYWNLFMFWGV